MFCALNDHLASYRYRHVQLTRCFSAVAELLVKQNAEICEVQRPAPMPTSSSRTLDPKTASTVEKILKFGRELHALSIRLKREFGKNEANKKALRVCIHIFCSLSFLCLLTFYCENSDAENHFITVHCSSIIHLPYILAYKSLP